jgi:hypothetical protein
VLAVLAGLCLLCWLAVLAELAGPCSLCWMCCVGLSRLLAGLESGGRMGYSSLRSGGGPLLASLRKVGPLLASLRKAGPLLASLRKAALRLSNFMLLRYLSS